jgi:hypothetical protein
MPPPREYDFDERMAMSQGHVQHADVRAILLANIPGALNVTVAHTVNDRTGVDYWVEMPGRHLSVDAKVREMDYALEGKDDLALETWSVIEKRVIGWTRNPDKRTDYILWLWKPTGRFCLLPFPMLCAVFTRYWQEWDRKYFNRKQKTPERNYHSACVFVPRILVWRSIHDMYGGAPAKWDATVERVELKAAACVVKPQSVKQDDDRPSQLRLL